MAIPRIDSYPFLGWRGRLHDATRRMAALPPRPGVSGVAWVVDAWNSVPDTIITTQQFDTDPDAQAELDAYRGLMNGSTYTAIDPLGKTRYVKVMQVTGEISQIPRRTKPYLLTASWTLQVEAAAP